MGYPPDEIARIYQQFSEWSDQLAFLQAIHDYAAVYNTVGTDMEHLTNKLPSVASVIPPPSVPPFAIESAIMVRRLRNSNNNNKRTRSRSPSPPIGFEQQQQQQP